jgi:hypothetical protein
MKAEVVSKDVGAEENGAKVWITWKYSLTQPKVKCLWIWKPCWGKGMELELVDKTWAPQKNSSYKFSQSPTTKRLNWICISLCPVTLPRGGKVRHQWGNMRSKCQAMTLYRSYINLSNWKRNATCTSRCRTVGMRLYKQGQQRPKWKDPMTSNVETPI